MLFPGGVAFLCAVTLATSSRNALGHWLGARGVPSDCGLGEDPLNPGAAPH